MSLYDHYFSARGTEWDRIQADIMAREAREDARERFLPPATFPAPAPKVGPEPEPTPEPDGAP